MRNQAEDSQTRILSYIREELQNKGYPPSVREICQGVGFKSTSTVHAHLNALERRGIIRRDATKPRAIELLDNPLSRGRLIPLLGKVTAGAPILAVENIEDELVLPQDMVSGQDLFALRIEGESMIEAGIFDGDIIIVNQQQSADNGQIVVAMIEDEATVKRIFYEKNTVRLQPENSAMEPIYARDVSVVGRVIALLRQF